MTRTVNHGTARVRELPYYSADGRELPWNVMGGTLTRRFSNVGEALTETGLDYQVQQVPMQGVTTVQGGAQDGAQATIDAPKHRGVIRPSVDGSEPRFLGVTGTRFTPIHNADAFAVADVLVAEFGATIEGVADYRNGTSSLLVVGLGQIDLGGGTDAVDLYLMVRNAHDGNAALTFALTGMRPACTNAVQAALRDAVRVWKISHTPNAAQRVELARQAILASVNYREAFQIKAEQMLDAAMSDREFDKIVANMYPVAEGEHDTRKGARRLEVRAQITGLHCTSPTLDGVRNTRWGGYNAVTEWLNWYRPVSGGPVARAEGALDGPYVRRAAAAWDTFAAA